MEANLLNTPIVSNNGVLTFTFHFTAADTGTLDAHDNLLNVHLPAKWCLVQYGEQTGIRISGFRVKKHGLDGLVCSLENLREELTWLESAYDFAGE